MSLLDPLLDKLFGPPTLRHVTEALSRALRSRGKTDLVVDPTLGTIQVRHGEKRTDLIRTGPLLADLLGQPRSARSAYMRRFLDRLDLDRQTAASGEMHFASVAQALLPVVRGAADLASAVPANEAGAATMSARVWRPLVNDAVAGLVVDRPDTMSFVTDIHLAAWGVSFDEAWAQALSNLRERTTPARWKRLGAGLWSGEWGDSYESSRLLLSELIQRLDVPDPVAMVPFRDALYVASGRDPAALEAMATLIERSAETRGRWISFEPAILDGTQWVPFTAPPALQEQFGRLRRLGVAAAYARQKELLDQQFAAENADVFVASYRMTKERGPVDSWVAWGKDVTHALLPVADVVAFVDPTPSPPDAFFVPWNRACEIVGHLMDPTELQPARVRVRRFPGADELLRLRAEAISLKG